MKTIEEIRKVYIDREIADGVVARNVRARAGANVNIEVVDDAKAVLAAYRDRGRTEGEKDTVLVYRYPGKFLSNCPGSDGMVCCNYFVINFGVGCLYDCHYCYLQNFMNNPLMTLFGNVEELFEEVRTRTVGRKFQFRIGTGEYTDSLALEELTGLSASLVNFAAGLDNVTLELKTKSKNVDTLLELDHRGKTVMAWSINPRAVVNAVETDTASLDERLDAAVRASEAGYRLAFHMDPVIHYEGWEADYHALIDEVLDRVNPDRIAWISLGAFRHAPGLKEVIQSRFAGDQLTRAEMVQGEDGKYRYFKTIRQEMFQSIRRKIEARDPRLFLYLCMETRRMWEKVFDFVPETAKNLDSLFDKRREYMDSVESTLASR